MPKNSMLRKIMTVLTGNMHFKWVVASQYHFNVLTCSLRCILLPNDPINAGLQLEESLLDPIAVAAERPPLSLWGLTLGMSLDLLGQMALPDTSSIGRVIAADKLYASTSSEPLYNFSVPTSSHDVFPTLLAPSMTSIFPTFSYPDINLFLWLFGFRYRYLVKRWGERLGVDSSSASSRPSTPKLHRRRSSSIPMTPCGSHALSAHAGRVNFAGMALNQFYAAVRKALIVAVVMRAILVFGSATAGILWLIRKLRERKRSFKAA